MKTEIEYAVNFLTTTLSEKLLLTTDEKTKTLKEKLTNLMQKRFEGHWYPEKPVKGSAYRCININIDEGSIDDVLRKAAEGSGFSVNDWFVVFNKGLAMWVDPNDVSYRLGKGAISPVYRKIADKTALKLDGNLGTLKHRPQQRPRSISPPQSILIHQQQQYQRSRSTTPPGFTSLDAGKLFQSVNNTKQSSMEDILKLWDTLPNTTSSNHTMTQCSPVSYTSSHSYQPRCDDVYSFNQYSSYYKPNSVYRKSAMAQQQLKPLWQSDNTYNGYYWSKNDGSYSVKQPYDTELNYTSYSTRQAQEVY